MDSDHARKNGNAKPKVSPNDRVSGTHRYGHTIYPSTIGYGPSECINDAVDSFLINVKPPKDGTRCEAIEVPGEGHPNPPTPSASPSNP
ncbi:hypothetical protein ACIBHX_46425 [Nonomuraea sp. NPDC050536]|uniref:hypothetical protein n=1 Tax=Nonomuraea sp. NPDC050536 TaxID=3364366 RepID=UPI0037CC9205